MFWHAGDIPSYATDNIETWKAHNRGWVIKIWSENSAWDMIMKYYTEIEVLCKSYVYKIQLWDVMRYFILNIEGGIYADLDMRCLKPIENLLDHDVVLYEESADIAKRYKLPSMIHHNFIYSEKNSVFLSTVLRNLKKYREGTGRFSMDKQINNIVGWTTGPFMLTHQFILNKRIEGIKVIPFEEIKQYIHHEEINSWKSNIKYI